MSIYAILSPLQTNASQADIRGLIRDKAIEHHQSVYLALSIAQCESSFVVKAKNPNSTAKGIFQFLNSTWKRTLERMDLPTNTSVFNPEVHIEAAMWLLEHDGTRHWLESKPCWKDAEKGLLAVK